ncbi:ADP-ribosylglycohydrolase family protein [Candidatus Saccharibacteria bacterium]|nr:ADP-ribosylglycohydrolase family protein [Candidatus Saccharibacteria bacterium]
MKEAQQPKYQDKARGMLLGLAIGDALGAPVEFLPESSDIHIKNMGSKIEHFHENYRAPKGVWTDDTEMALCIADSLLVNEGYDSYDIMNRFRAWSEEGYRTYDGMPACDVGMQTQRAIDEYNNHPIIPKDIPKTESAGNGAIMRLAPIIIANTFLDKKYPTLKDGFNEGKLVIDPEDNNSEFIDLKDITPTLDMAVLSCRETHNSLAAEATTALFATMLYCALHGLPKNHIASYCSRWIMNDGYDRFYYENSKYLVDRALEKDGEKLCNLGGYIVDTFAIALWGLFNFNSFKDGMMAVIRLGGDTDTNGACYGQLAGAYYGYKSIPGEWRKEVYFSDELVEIADNLLKMAKCSIIKTRFEDDENFREH